MMKAILFVFFIWTVYGLSETEFYSMPTAPTDGNVLLHDVAVNNGYLYAVGEFNSIINFGGMNVSAANTAESDGYIAKYDTSMNLIWAIAFTGNGNTSPTYAIEADSNGDLIIGGLLHGTTDFGGHNMSAVTDQDIYIAKYSADSTFVWGKQFGSNGDHEFGRLSLGPSNTIAVCSDDAGDISYGGQTFPETGYIAHTTFAKLDSTGNHVFSFAVTGNDSDTHCGGISLDSKGNLIGAVRSDASSIMVNGQSIVSSGDYDIVVFKYSSSGAFQWFKHFGTQDRDNIYGLYTDSQNNIIFTGSWGNLPISFGGPDLQPPSYNDDVFVVKLKNDGSFIWQTAFGSGNNDYGLAVTVGDSDSIYVAGAYGGATTGAVTLPDNLNGAFLVELTSDGTVSASSSYNSTQSIPTENSFGVEAVDGYVGLGFEYFEDVSSINSTAQAQSSNTNVIVVVLQVPDDGSDSSRVGVTLLVMLLGIVITL